MSGKGQCSAIYLLSLIFAPTMHCSAQPLDIPQLRTAIQAPAPNRFNRVCVAGTTAYASDSSSFSVIDVSNPAAPILIRRLKLPFSDSGELFVGGSRLLVEGGSGFCVYDISDPRNPELGGGNAIAQPPLGGAAIGGVYLTSDTALVSLWWPFPLTIQTFDISDALAPTQVGFTRPDHLNSGGSLFMKSAGTLSFCYHQGETGLLSVVDCASPRAIQVLSTISVFGGDSMSISDGKVFLFGPQSQVIDVSDPTKPGILDEYKIPSWPKQFRPTVLKNRAYVLDGGLQTYDLSDPANPRRTGGVVCGANDVAFANNHAFVASGSELLIIQIADAPQSPALNMKKVGSDQWAIRWPTHAVEYQLFTSDGTGPGSNWQPVVAAPGTDNGFFSIPMGVSGAAGKRVFQLRAKTPP